jgi:hypothetical protein
VRKRPVLWILLVVMGLSSLPCSLSKIGEIVATPVALVSTAAPAVPILPPGSLSEADAVEQLIVDIPARVGPASDRLLGQPACCG